MQLLLSLPMSLPLASPELMELWPKLDITLGKKLLLNLEISFKLMKIFIMTILFNGTLPQIMESLTHMLSIEKLMPEMDSNSVAGPTHSDGLTLVSMMIKFLPNTLNLDLIPQLIMDLVTRLSLTSSYCNHT